MNGRHEAAAQRRWPTSGTPQDRRGRDLLQAADLGASAVLVRPDGYIAWATDIPDDTLDLATVHDAWVSWLGTPEHVSVSG
jgi:hypothetical protein